jgi:hypothetical protein
VTARRPRNWPAIAGLVLGLAGVLGYLLVVFRLGALLPRVRNGAAPDWMLIAAGLGLSALGVVRGGRPAAVLAAVNVGLAVAFAWLLYGMSAVPAAAGPTVGAPAPDFALVDQDGRLRRLADFRGAPLLLVFYRGHW